MANHRVNTLRHEERTSTKIGNSPPQASAKVRELAWANQYYDNDENKYQVGGLEQSIHWISESIHILRESCEQ